MASIAAPPATMAAVRLTGHGGLDRLAYATDVPVPRPGPGEVLIEVRAAAVNTTDINTRLGWYAAAPGAPGDWTGRGLGFPRIQGADLSGRVAATGAGVDPARLGQRVIVQPCLRARATAEGTPWLGSEVDGAYADYVVAPAADTHAVVSTLSDAELAAIPCAYGTAQNLIERAGLAPAERVLITGASGAVGLAAVELAHLAGAEVTAVAAPQHWAVLAARGAARCQARDAALTGPWDAVIDVVGGPGWPGLLAALRPGGRLATSGAIAGPLVELDLRMLYLRDLTLIGCTTQGPGVFPTLLRHLAGGRLRPLVAATYPLAQIADAQTAFLAKAALGKIVLIPPGAAINPG